MKLDKETRELIMNSCLDDSTKIINYLKEQEQKTETI